MMAGTVRRLNVTALAIGALLTMACEINASVGRDEIESAGGGEGGALTDGEDDAGVATQGDGDDGAGSAGGEGGGGDAGGSGESGRTTATGGDGVTDIPLCQHHDGDTECAVCRKAECCAPMVACHDAEGCFCFWHCVIGDGATVDGCHAECSFDGQQWNELVSCQQERCLAACGDQPPTDVPPTDVPTDD